VSVDAADAVKVSGITGKAWVFPNDYINTDAIMPRAGYDLAPAEQNALILNTIRPGWAKLVEPGDILVAGRNFGTGSSRPAVTLLSRIGIAAIVSESVGEVFFRNCISYAMPVMQCPGVLDIVAEGDTLSIDIAIGELINRTSGVTATGPTMPAMLLDTVRAGGAYQLLRRDGYL
jgi:3-isopropylmalate/(R)-2-methylmalate dehydratase small subunit